MNAPVNIALDEIDDADLYGRETRNTPPWIKRAADAEWRAMDNFGRLPAGWVNPHIPANGEGKEV